MSGDSECPDEELDERTDLLLRLSMAPGDVVLLTGVVRDLDKLGKYRIAVQTTDQCLWNWNPHVVRREELQKKPLRVRCDWSTQHWHLPGHLLTEWARSLADKLKIPAIPITEFRGDIWLSREEKDRPVTDLVGDDEPYWVLNAGNKLDRQVKGWPSEHFQRVVDALSGRVRFVQIGHDFPNHRHPRLDGVLNLIGKTRNTRDLIRLIYRSSGVISGISCPMHLAAAVPTRDGALRPCVVIAGGSEPDHFIHYPGHTVASSVGRMECCKSRGCWRRYISEKKPGEKIGHEDCLKHHAGFADCMWRISPEWVVEAVKSYL